MMEGWLALSGGLAIGVVLGLLGGGGALMAIPVLIYAFQYPFRIAVGSGLALVAMGVLPALIMHVRNRQIDWLSAVMMGGTGIIGAAIGSQISAMFPKAQLLWLLIALMALSAYNMLKTDKRGAIGLDPQPPHRQALLGAGLGIGLLTGLVGVGGGFLLVPALLYFGRLSARVAIATSLLIIGANALAGAIGYWQLLPWQHPSFLWLMSGSLLGSMLGYRLNLKLPSEVLKRGFGLLLIALMALLVLSPPS